MIIKIHDLAIESFIEADNKKGLVVNVSVDVDIETFISTAELLSPLQKAELERLWFDENVDRNYERFESGVIVSESPSSAPSP